MNIGGNKTKCLVSDLDGSLIHNFLNKDDISQIYNSLLKVSEQNEIVINTACNIEYVINRLAIPDDQFEQFCFITNCGEKIILHGKEIKEWNSFIDSLPSITREQINLIQNCILQSSKNKKQYRIINKFYVNFKAENPSPELINSLNSKLLNENLEICYNQHNVKLISNKVNKGKALEYIQKQFCRTLTYIGIGNSIIDNHFLRRCDKSYMINNESDKLASTKSISIKNKEDYNLFFHALISEFLDN